MEMNLEYSRRLLEKGCVFGHQLISSHDGLVVVNDSMDGYEDVYLGTQMIDGEFQTDERGMVTFTRVTPVIDEDTRFA